MFNMDDSDSEQDRVRTGIKKYGVLLLRAETNADNDRKRMT